MADKKVTDLTDASTVNDSDEFYLVQSGADKSLPWDVMTTKSVGDPGGDDVVPTEQAVREALPSAPTYRVFDSDWMISPKDGSDFDLSHGFGSEPDFVQMFFRGYTQGGSAKAVCPTMASVWEPMNRYTALGASTVKVVPDIGFYATAAPNRSGQYAVSGELRLMAIDKTANYDSGWISASINTTYTKSHGLGAVPDLIILELAENADGSGWRVPCMGSSNFANGAFKQTSVVEITSSAVKIRTGAKLARINKTAGTLTEPSSGYYRLQCFSWTPDYDSGWTTGSIDSMTAFKHDLGGFPSVVQLEVSDVDDYSSDVLLANGGYLESYVNGTLVQHIGDTYAVVHVEDNWGAYKDASGTTQFKSSTPELRLKMWE